MKLILARHGHDMACANGSNALSWQGKKQARDLAEKVVSMGVSRVDAACSSTSQRCVQTLDEIEACVSIKMRSTANELTEGRASEDLELLVWRLWEDQQSTLLIVGHEPQISNSVLRWSGLPENGDQDLDQPPWTLARGEGLLVRPQYDEQSNIVLGAGLITFLGRTRQLPRSNLSTRAGVF